MDKEKVAALKNFVTVLKANPDTIHLPELAFFKEYLLSLGANLGPVSSPRVAGVSSPRVSSPKAAEPTEADFFDLDDPDRMVAETVALPPKGVKGLELSDADQERVSALKSQASEAIENGHLGAALELYNTVISMGSVSAMMYTKRADLLLKLKRPLAAIADCDAALLLNPDSAKAFRIRGLALRGLQKWEAAHSDLSTAQTIDFDEATETVKKLVDTKCSEILLAKRAFRMASKVEEEEVPRDVGGGFGAMPGMPSGMPSGMPAGMPDMGALFSDPEIMGAMSNPKVMAAMQAMMTNPAAFLQYQNDPEVGPVLAKLMSKMGGMGGL